MHPQKKFGLRTTGGEAPQAPKLDANMSHVTTVSTAAPNKPFRLLDLPAELRVLIYEFAAAEIGATIKPCGWKLAIRSRLLGVSQQVRKEFQDIKASEFKLVAQVKDLNFSLVRKYLFYASNQVLQKLSGLGGEREFIIVLELTYDVLHTLGSLTEWLRFLETQASMGKAFEVTYEVKYPIVPGLLDGGSYYDPFAEAYVRSSISGSMAKEYAKIMGVVKNAVQLARESEGGD